MDPTFPDLTGFELIGFEYKQNGVINATFFGLENNKTEINNKEIINRIDLYTTESIMREISFESNPATEGCFPQISSFKFCCGNQNNAHKHNFRIDFISGCLCFDFSDFVTRISTVPMSSL